MLDAIFWTADPVLFSLGPLTIRWYSLAFLVGFICGYNIVARMFRHEGAPEDWLTTLLVYLIVGTVVGARLGHVFFYEWDYFSQHPLEILYTWNGGLASHGGTIGCAIMLLIFSRYVAHKPASWVFDKIVVPAALVAALIRLGNLMNSEVYGSHTDVAWGFIFARNGEVLPSHPTQLYEALCYLALFGVLMWMYWKRNAQERSWLLTGIFFTVTFLSRFCIEFVKNVQVVKEYGIIEHWGLNIGQLLSIPFIIVGIVLIVWAMTHPKVKFQFPDKFADVKGKKK